MAGFEMVAAFYFFVLLEIVRRRRFGFVGRVIGRLDMER